MPVDVVALPIGANAPVPVGVRACTWYVKGSVPVVGAFHCRLMEFWDGEPITARPAGAEGRTDNVVMPVVDEVLLPVLFEVITRNR